VKKHPVGIAFSQKEKIQAANLTFLLAAGSATGYLTEIKKNYL
jgi:hypothetical protein